MQVRTPKDRATSAHRKAGRTLRTYAHQTSIAYKRLDAARLRALATQCTVDARGAK